MTKFYFELPILITEYGNGLKRKQAPVYDFQLVIST